VYRSPHNPLINLADVVNDGFFLVQTSLQMSSATPARISGELISIPRKAFFLSQTNHSCPVRIT
jgi:hypothetical protein